jgi:hypothetical protein
MAGLVRAEFGNDRHLGLDALRYQGFEPSP